MYMLTLILLFPIALNGMQTPNGDNANVANSVQTDDVDSDQESVATTVPGDGDIAADIADLEEAIEQFQGIKG